MKNNTLLFLLAIFTFMVLGCNQGIQKATTVILVRHAEKLKGKDPNLTTEGLQRANELARLLSKSTLDVVYSTDYKRTLKTATPTANNHNLKPILYSPKELEKLAKLILEKHQNGKVMVVGHSNTTPALLNILTGKDYKELSELEYDNLYILTIYGLGDGEVLHMKYGERKP